MKNRFLKSMIVFVASLVFVAGCGSDDDSGATDDAMATTTADSTDDSAATTTGESTECVENTGEQLTVYSGRSEDLISPLFDSFTCATGVDLRVRWESSTDLAVLINEEGSATEADVFLSRSPGPVGFLEAEGHLAVLDDEVLELVEPEFRSAAGTWVGFSGRKRVLVSNLDTVADDELPASVFDLTGDTYEGRVAIPATNGSFEDWFTVLRSEVGDEAATQWLADMVANNARYYPDNRSIVDAVARGEIDMGLVNHYYNYQEVAVRGDEHRAQNVDFEGGDVGSVVIITAATALESSEKQDLANQFIAHLLTPESQQFFTDETFEYPLVEGVTPNTALPPLEFGGVGSVDFDALGGGFTETEQIIQESGILNQ
ncbi:MAG: extracellular solute-binding protein [Acidimicrobiales bacterium]